MEIYQLKEQLENCTHAKVNFEIDEQHLNCDLGNYETIDGEVKFVPLYTSAVINKTDLNEYVNE